MIKNCLQCNKKFRINNYRKDTAKFCSKSCKVKFEKPTCPPEKRNISGLRPRKKGEYHHTLETRKKIGLNTPKYEGKKHWNWKGGIHKDITHRRKLQMIRAKRHLYLKRGNGGSYTLGEWELLKLQYGHTCACCKRKEPEIKLEADHIIPLSKGGLNIIENLQPLCHSCNASKHTKIIKY